MLLLLLLLLGGRLRRFVLGRLLGGRLISGRLVSGRVIRRCGTLSLGRCDGHLGATRAKHATEDAAEVLGLSALLVQRLNVERVRPIGPGAGRLEQLNGRLNVVLPQPWSLVHHQLRHYVHSHGRIGATGLALALLRERVEVAEVLHEDRCEGHAALFGVAPSGVVWCSHETRAELLRDLTAHSFDDRLLSGLTHALHHHELPAQSVDVLFLALQLELLRG
mmetsp:Transcript_20210/g.42598  ORF Transcript_20210/g.42598 Transcript_20210/m.42598 type:complete len:221 (-) Transcript_20210:193-855(-)